MLVRNGKFLRKVLEIESYILFDVGRQPQSVNIDTHTLLYVVMCWKYNIDIGNPLAWK